MIDLINKTTAYIRERIDLKPEFGIILGTGLGALVDEIDMVGELPYEDIPNFPVSTVESHKGRLIFGWLSGRKVVVMQGRFHHYEGYTMQQITFPVRVMKALGISKLLVSNVAGALNSSYELGDLMLIEDHINLQYENPLTGKNLDTLGPRFPDMSEPYDPVMIDQAYAIAQANGYRVHKGVYVSVPGPNLETRAEYRFLSIIGADAVGMSTVPEIIVARHMNIPCFAISVMTDLCAPGKLKKITIAEIIEIAHQAQPKLMAIMKGLVAQNP